MNRITVTQRLSTVTATGRTGIASRFARNTLKGRNQSMKVTVEIFEDFHTKEQFAVDKRWLSPAICRLFHLLSKTG